MWRTAGIGTRVVADDAVSASANNFVFGRDGRGAGIAWLGILGHAFPSLPWEDLVGPELRRAGTDRGPRGGGSKWGGADDVLSHDRSAGEGAGISASAGCASGSGILLPIGSLQPGKGGDPVVFNWRGVYFKKTATTEMYTISLQDCSPL